MFNKTALIKALIKQLSQELEIVAGASRAMHADASDEQNKAEDQYDTRGLETAYLASSQARQATATEAALAAYHTLKPAKFTPKTPIDLTAVVELDSHGERTTYFLGPKGGGIEVHLAGRAIVVITPDSPIGQQLMGKKAGDRFKLQTRGPEQELKIISVQ